MEEFERRFEGLGIEAMSRRVAGAFFSTAKIGEEPIGSPPANAGLRDPGVGGFIGAAFRARAAPVICRFPASFLAYLERRFSQAAAVDGNREQANSRVQGVPKQ